jgi:NADH:ubiquinone oxidoreductase subunit 4 (subunit M)
LYNRVVFGTLKTTYISRFSDISRRECVILATLLLSMAILGLSANFILEFLHFPVKTILFSGRGY